MQPEITQAISNIRISKTYIDNEITDSRVVTASEIYIVSPVRDRTTSFYAHLRRQFGFHVRPLVDKNRPGLCKVYVRKRGLKKTNKSISTGDSGREDFDETLSNNIDRG